MNQDIDEYILPEKHQRLDSEALRFRVNKLYNRLTVSAATIRKNGGASHMTLSINPARQIVRIELGFTGHMKLVDNSVYLPKSTMDLFKVDMTHFEVDMVFDEEAGWWSALLAQARPYSLKKNQRTQ